MRTRVRKGQRGLSLIEVTIMLLVLMLLTSVLAPSIFDFVQDAQWVKVKEDCEVIAISLARLIKDVGPRLVTQRGSYASYKMDIMVSDGNPPAAIVPGPVTGFPNGTLTNWWNGTPADPRTANHIGTCDEQLITNEAGVGRTVAGQIYPEPTSQFGLKWGQGWRGAYLSPPCGPDPWGYAYQVNTTFFPTVFIDNTLGEVYKFHCQDVFCLSPGKNGVIETPFGVSFTGNVPNGPQGTKRGGDDWVTVISPCDP